MVEYSVILKRYEGSSRPDVVIFRDENRDKAIEEMRKYDKKYGFSVQDKDGIFSIKTILLEEAESIDGAPILSSVPYHKLFDHLGNSISEA